MIIGCTRCERTGFININQLPDYVLISFDEEGDHDVILKWIKNNDYHDVSVCDCCGDTESWYGNPGEHYTENDPKGINGPYAYNGGLCECN